MTVAPHLEIRKSKHGEEIPVINGVFIHSAYNPVKEAEAFVENHLATLRQKNNILLLGLGFGYHLDQILYHLNNFHSEFRVVVIEPMKAMAEACSKVNGKNLKRSILLTGKEINELYQDPHFIRFLMNKPGVIAHPASFNFHGDYFRNLLSYEAEQSLEAFSSRMPAGLVAALSQYPAKKTLNHLFADLEVKPSLDNAHEFLLGALMNWTQGCIQEKQNEKHTDC